MPGAYVKIGYFENDADLLFQDEIHGPLIFMPDKVMETIYLKYFKGMISYRGIQRVESYPVPREAMREAILNAIVYRLYHSPIPIQIRVYSDKVVISNDGRLPEDWTIDDLLSAHRSEPHNPSIARVFFRSGMIETWGRGVERINNALRAEGKADIDYEYNGADIVAVFNTSVKADCTDNCTDKITLNDTEKAVMELMRQNPSITTTQIADALKVVRRTVSNAIKRMKDYGVIERNGSDRAGFWKVGI
jgi:ATP-dependent DNA helicase RecG